MARKTDDVVQSGAECKPHEESPKETILVSKEIANRIKVETDLPIALVIEPLPCMAEILRGHNWSCESYHPVPLLAAHFQQVSEWMNAGKYRFVWIRRPGRDSMQPGRRASFERASMRLMFQAEAMGIFAIHCSYLKPGQAYKDELMQSGLKVSEHYFCHFGVRYVNQKVMRESYAHDR